MLSLRKIFGSQLKRCFSDIEGMPMPILLIHGGAGDIPDNRVEGKLLGIKVAVREGMKYLLDSESDRKNCALNAVEAAVRSMELDENFNAGYGSVVNADGVVEMEASIMDGNNLNAGCITLLQDVIHPISVARRLMETSNHTFLGGANAQKFAIENGFPLMKSGSLVTENAVQALKKFKARALQGKDTTFARTELDDEVRVASGERPGEPGTVGAVAVDASGNIAAATSTGGITGKWPGRIGDTPILGAGTYADSRVGAVSTTGHGETIYRFNLAQRILGKLSTGEISPKDATEETCKEMTDRLTGTGGAICLDVDGNIGVYWTSKRMAWAYALDGKLIYGIEHGEVFKEPLDPSLTKEDD